MQESISINEIFPSLEGETKYVGMPTLFIRTQGCSLACPYCDTKQSWDVNKGTRLTVEGVVEIATRILNRYPGIKRVSFTGGNPLIWLPQIKLISELLKYNNNSLIFNLEHPGYYDFSKKALEQAFAEWEEIESSDIDVTLDFKLFCGSNEENKLFLIFQNLALIPKSLLESSRVIYKFIVQTEGEIDIIRYLSGVNFDESISPLLDIVFENIWCPQILESIDTPFLYVEENVKDALHLPEKYISVLRTKDKEHTQVLWELVQLDLLYIPGYYLNYPLHIAMNFR